MKNKFIIFLLLFLSLSSFSQCWVADLRNDLYTREARENGFLDFFATDNLNKKEAYRILHTEAKHLRNNLEELSLVSKNLEDIKKAGGYSKWRNLNNVVGELSFADKIKLFVKNQNSLLSYARKDGTFFMQRSPSNKNLSTGLSNELTFSFKYNKGPNANSKDVFGKIGLSENGYLVANLKKPKGMNNQQIKGVSEDAFDMALHHFGLAEVKGIKALWVKNLELYPTLPDNKSINLIRFEEALKTTGAQDAAFKTITGGYAESRSFNKILDITKLEESVDGVYGYEIIFVKK